MMRNIETFPSKQMYPYLSLVERKEAEALISLVRMTSFLDFFQTIAGCWCPYGAVFVLKEALT